MPNPFNQSNYEDEARSRQVSTPPPRRIKPILIEHCSACGSPMTIALGYAALVMIRQVKLRVLMQAGWQVAPRLLCRTCACPMSPDDTLKAVTLWNRIADNKNNLADIKAWEAFEKAMQKEYGDKVNRYFNTMPLQGKYTIVEDYLTNEQT